jgi:ABC-type Fe3+-hydroxamate transport system substrate-binding protein
LHAHRSITYLLITALACIFLSGCIGRPSPPKTGSIIGTVKDAMSHTPLRGATVDAGPKRSAATGPNGTFTLSNVPAGRVILNASCPGYRPRQVNVTVPAGNSINCEIELYPNTSGPATVRGCATVANNYYPEGYAGVSVARGNRGNRMWNTGPTPFSRTFISRTGACILSQGHAGQYRRTHPPISLTSMRRY